MLNITQESLCAPRRHLLIGTGIAFLIATVALVVAVLPAEFGVDPIGAGRLLGLSAMCGGVGRRIDCN